MNTSSQDGKVCGLFQKRRLLSETLETKVWEVLDDTGCTYVAKMTQRNENGKSHRSFTAEHNVLSVLEKASSRKYGTGKGITLTGFPNLIFSGRHGDNYDVLVMELLSPDVFIFLHHRRWTQKFTIERCLLVSRRMLFALKDLHWHGFVHRDVKPENFRMDSHHCPSLVNFSDAQYYIRRTTCQHISEGREACFIGTLKYASLNAHFCKMQSRRDDLVSLGYCIINMINKALPWDSDSLERQTFGNRNDTIRRMKENLPLWILCDGLPSGILRYMQEVTNLSFQEVPNYEQLSQLLKL